MKAHTNYLSIRALRLFLATAVAVFLVAGCSGGGSSSGSAGGGGSATIAGNVSSGVASLQRDPTSAPFVIAALNRLTPAASAAGVPGVEVQLVTDGIVLGSQMTDNSGNFRFTGLPEGSYSIRLLRDGQSVGESAPISLASNTETDVRLSLSGEVTRVDVAASGDTISGQVSNDDNSSDDLSSDDADSVDGSSDDDSSDDLSDDDSGDDDSSDDGDSSDDDSSD